MDNRKRRLGGSLLRDGDGELQCVSTEDALPRQVDAQWRDVTICCFPRKKYLRRIALHVLAPAAPIGHSHFS